jgi:osmotically-inducible protein OsmY
MKKYAFLIASLTAASTFAGNRDPGAIGGRLGDGAFMKATGMSAVEWAAQCGRHKNDSASLYRPYSYSETQRLMPEQTPLSTETLQGETGTVASSANTQSSTSAGSSQSANYSATTNDSTPAAGDSLSDNHNLGLGSSASVSTGNDHSIGVQDHSPLYTDKSDYSTAGAPASTERGTGSSDSNVSTSIPPIPGSALSPDAAWSTQIKSDLTRETPDNTSLSTFTSANLQNVQINRSNGTVMLRGTVPSEKMKQDIETRVRELSAGAPVNNQLSVAPSADLPANGSSVPRD